MKETKGKWGSFKWDAASRDLSYVNGKQVVWEVALPPSIDPEPLIQWIQTEAETSGWEIRSLSISFLNRKDPSHVPLPLVFLKGDSK